MKSPIKVQTPEQLIISSEQFVLNITEPLDPLVSLTLTGVMKQLVNVAYLMGHADGKQRDPSEESI
jgi:hypothetical protein